VLDFREEGESVKSVLLAWGSLVWDPKGLETAAQFAANGPLLPIEFCSIAADGRLTLAIDETFGALCKTYSAPSALQTLDAAIENLRARERMSNSGTIGFVEPASGRQSDVAMERHPEAVATIGAWATASGYDAAIWMAVASNFDDKGGEPFSVSAAIQYLETLEADDPAKFAAALAYIRNAPPEIETPVRERVAKRWPG
jgi:hypothetical protein